MTAFDRKSLNLSAPVQHLLNAVFSVDIGLDDCAKTTAPRIRI
jgi:hypothetical protein